MDIVDEEILNLWRKFHELEFQYIMVGGFATNLNGHLRTTGDVDIWIKDTVENRRKLIQALEELGIGKFPMLEKMKFVPGWTGLRLNSGLELDIMTHLKGFESEKFDECQRVASVATIDHIPVPFLHINHLIEEKKLVNREKDQIDVLALEKIKALRKKGKT